MIFPNIKRDKANIKESATYDESFETTKLIPRPEKWFSDFDWKKLSFWKILSVKPASMCLARNQLSGDILFSKKRVRMSKLWPKNHKQVKRDKNKNLKKRAWASSVLKIIKSSPRETCPTCEKNIFASTMSKLDVPYMEIGVFGCSKRNGDLRLGSTWPEN